MDGSISLNFHGYNPVSAAMPSNFHEESDDDDTHHIVAVLKQRSPGVFIYEEAECEDYWDLQQTQPLVMVK